MMRVHASITQPFVATSAKSSTCTAVVTHAQRSIPSAGRKVVLIFPAVIPPASVAWAEGLVDAAQQGAEAGRQALSVDQVPQWNQIQIPSGLRAPNDIANIFGSSNVNPILLLGAVAAIAVPALLFQALSPGSRIKGSSPANVLAALADEPKAQLVDIRSSAEVKSSGSPDLKSARRRVLSLPYTQVGKNGSTERVAGWADKAAKLGALKADSIVILLDSDGKTARKAASELDSNAVDEIYIVNGGAAAWQSSGQPWREPGRGGFSLDLSGLTQSVSRGIGTIRIKAGEESGGSSLPDIPKDKLLTGAGVVLGAFLLVTQTGTFLELVGLGAAANYALKNLVFAKDRERSTKQFRELVVPEEAVKDVQRLTSALLEDTEGKVEEAAGKAKETVSRAADDVQSKASEAKANVKPGGEGASDKVAVDVKDDAKAWIESWKDRNRQS